MENSRGSLSCTWDSAKWHYPITEQFPLTRVTGQNLRLAHIQEVKNIFVSSGFSKTNEQETFKKKKESILICNVSESECWSLTQWRFVRENRPLRKPLAQYFCLCGKNNFWINLLRATNDSEVQTSGFGSPCLRVVLKVLRRQTKSFHYVTRIITLQISTWYKNQQTPNKYVRPAEQMTQVHKKALVLYTVVVFHSAI